MYLARYYVDREKWIPAINRFKKVVKDYDETIYIEEALHRLVELHYKLGLIDEIGEIRTVLRERFGAKVKLKFITKKKGFLSGILQSAFHPLISKIFDEIDNKAYWNRFGL